MTGRHQGLWRCSRLYLMLCCMLLHALQALQPALDKFSTADGIVSCAQRMDTDETPSAITCSMKELFNILLQAVTGESSRRR